MPALTELASSINEQIKNNNSVVLSEDGLGISGLTELLSPYAANQTSLLVKTSEKAILDKGVVRFQGTIDFLNNKNTPSQITLKNQDGDLTLRLDITPAKSVTLLGDFPMFRTDQEYPEFLNVDRYIFTTKPDSDILQAGLNVEIVSKPFPYLERVTALIPGAKDLKQIRMKGNISIASNAANVNLALDVGTPDLLNFDLIKLLQGKVALELSARSNEQNVWNATAAIYLSGAVELAGLTVSVRAQFTPSGILFIRGTPVSENKIQLSELTNLFGNSMNMEDMLPKPLRKPDKLSLEQVIFVLDLARGSIISVVFDLRMQDWQACDFITVTGIVSKWQWYASDQSFDLMLMGVARIRDKIEIEVEIDSRPAITGTMRIDKVQSLESLVNDVTGENINLGKFKDVDIEFITLAANLQQSTFQFGFGASGDVAIAPGFDLKRFEVEVQLASETNGNLVTATGELLAGITPIHVTGKLGAPEGGTFIGSVSRLPLTQLVESFLNGLPIQSMPEIVLGNIHLELSTIGKFALEASIEVDFGDIGASMGIPIPVGMPEINLDRIAIEVDSATSFWSIELISNKTYLFPKGGNNHVGLSQIALRLSKPHNKDMAVDCSLTFDGKISLGDIISVEINSLFATWNSTQSSWSVAGKVNCQLFGTGHALIPEFTGDAEYTTLKLTYESEIPLIIIKEIASFTIEKFYVCIENQKHEGQDKKADWGVGGHCRLNLIPIMVDTPAELFLKTGSGGSEFGLSVGGLSPVTLGLAAGIEAKLTLQPFEIKYGKVKDENAQWHANGGGSLSLINIPKELDKYFPIEELSIELGFGTDEVFIRATGFLLSQNLPRLRVELPDNLLIDLGQPAISVEVLTLHFGDDLKLSQQIDVSGLRELNRIFGVDNKGEPKAIILNPECSGELLISAKKGITLRLKSSPFSSIPTREEKDGSTWSEWWQIGDIMNVSIQVPEFAFDTNTATWSASGGILKRGDIKFPLMPLKWLLNLLKVDKNLVKVIPDGIPIKAPDGNALNLLSRLTDLAGSNSADFQNLIKTIGKQLERLPTRFTEYVTAEIPDGFQFKVETSTTGNVKFDISMGAPEEKDPTPIKFMFPCSAPLPEIIGVTLNRISLGELFGGSILLLEFDGYIDRFPLENLIGSCLLPDEIMSKETANSLSYRIISNDMMALIPAAAGIPFPIPLFYSEFGIEYHHLSGLKLQSHFKFPKPEGGFIAAIGLLSRLLEFFSDKEYLLHKQPAPENLDLKFTLGENYIGLPDYLKCQPLGLNRELPAISAYENVSRLLDAMKTANLGYLIEAIPLRVNDDWIRVNKFNIRFGPIEFEAAWCITTEEEFVNTVLMEAKPAGKLPDNIDDSILKSLPKSATAHSLDKGFIILLMGGVDLGPVVGLHAQFGMSLTKEAGFQTGFRLMGTIAQTLSLEISGRIEANTEKVAIAGALGLYWNEQSLIVTKGKISVGEKSFAVEIILELTPFFTMSGTLEIGSNGFYMKGIVQWQHGTQPESGYTAELKIDGNGVSIGFELKLLAFDAEIKINLPGNKGQLFLARVDIIIPDSLIKSYSNSIKALAKDAVAKGVNKAYNDVEDAVKKLDGLEVSISGLRNWLPDLCREIARTVDNNIVANTKGWKYPGRSVARRIAKPYITRVTKLGDIAKRASEKSIRLQLKNTINDILNNNHLRIRISIKTFWKTYKVTILDRRLMNNNQVASLKDAVKWIDELPNQTNIKIKSEQIYNQFPPREKMLGQIQREIDNGVEGAIPTMESLGFETGLGALDATNVKLTAVYIISGERQQIELDADLSKPDQIAHSLVEKLLP